MVTLFTRTYKHGAFVSDENDNPIYEERIVTYQAEDDGTHISVYEFERDGSRKLRYYARKRAGITEQQIVEDISSDKRKVNQSDFKQEYAQGHQSIQTTYPKRVQNISATTYSRPQLVALVRVSDIRRQRVGTFIGYSRKIPSTRPSSVQLKQADEEAIAMAIGKFCVHYGEPESSYDDIVCVILDRRFQYWIK